jgi:hypothetical protein
MKQLMFLLQRPGKRETLLLDDFQLNWNPDSNISILSYSHNTTGASKPIGIPCENGTQTAMFQY